MRAAVFPGQGVRTADVLSSLENATRLVESASEIIGEDLRRRAEIAARGSKGVLPTSVAQPAIFVAEVAGYESAGDTSFDYFAGHSLGEYAALVAAGSMSFADGLKLVVARGEAMGRISKTTHGGMAAVIGLDLDGVTELARTAGVQVANDNAPDQVVVSGSDEGLAKAASLAHSSGARAVLLGVEGPFHTEQIAGAGLKLAAVLREVELAVPNVPVISNVTARPYTSVEEIRDLLIKQVSTPVRWRESVEWMWRQGVREFVDVGPGRVLTALIKRTTGKLVEVSSG
jgi:[acyl-carrier-protein] S-malonyltransferase